MVSEPAEFIPSISFYTPPAKRVHRGHDLENSVIMTISEGKLPVQDF